MSTPKFERDPDHEFKQGEEIFVIDENEFDIYKGRIISKQGLQFTIEYPDYDYKLEEITDTYRLLPNNRTNKRIFQNQDSLRRQKESDMRNEEDKSDLASDNGDDDKEGEYRPAGSLKNEHKEKGKQGRKPSKKVKPPPKPKPQNCRTNPPRNAKKLTTNIDMDDDDSY